MRDDEQMARRVARIMGPNSAAAKALAELEERRAKGQRWADIFYRHGMWQVTDGEKADPRRP